LWTCSLSVHTDPINTGTCTYSTWDARKAGFSSIIWWVGNLHIKYIVCCGHLWGTYSTVRVKQG